MQGARQQILFEFFEKLFAALAFGVGSVLSPIALFPLLGRRVAWLQSTPRAEQARTIAYREIALFLALAVGALLAQTLKLLPFDPVIVAVFFLILSIGMMLLAEKSTAALLPKLESKEWSGTHLRNSFGWVLLGLSLAAFWKGFPSQTLLGSSLIAMLFAGVPVAMAYRRGEPGLLIPGALIYLIGVGFGQPWIAAAGLGWLVPAAVLVTRNLRASFALRSLLCWLGAWAGLELPGSIALAAPVILFGLTLEMWRFPLRLATYLPLRTLHRFKIYGSENYASDGPGIVISNHVTLADGFLLGAMTQRMVRFLVFDAFYKNPVSRFGLNLFRTIPISQGARREAIESLRKVRAVIEEGHFAGIFPEGGITRSGHLHPFQKGFTRILSGTQIPVIPAYMNGLWNSLLSFSEQKVNLRVGRWFRPLEIEYGTPLPPTVTAPELWRVVKSLEVNAAFRDSEKAPTLPMAFLESAAKHDRWIAVEAGRQKISYGVLASSSLLFARHINRRLRRKARIGIFLPDGVEKAIAHVSVVMAGHVAMEVPELSGTELEQFISGHGLGTLVTSQAWLDAHELKKSDGMFFIGRALEKFDSRDRNRIWLYRKLSPHAAWRQVCTHAMRKETAAAIVGSPRGPVVLSHRGIWSAAWSARRVLWWKPGITVRNRVPLNRAAGLSLGFWMPLLNGAKISFDNTAADFEVLDAENAHQAHAESKHVIVVEDETRKATTEAVASLGNRYLPMFELAEASGALSISSPPVDFMGELQTGAKAETLGRLPFGLEMEKSGEGIKLRSPARLLRYLDAGEPKTHSRIDDWFEVPVPLDLSDQCFVERKITSEPQISSTSGAQQAT